MTEQKRSKNNKLMLLALTASWPWTSKSNPRDHPQGCTARHRDTAGEGVESEGSGYDQELVGVRV